MTFRAARGEFILCKNLLLLMIGGFYTPSCFTKGDVLLYHIGKGGLPIARNCFYIWLWMVLPLDNGGKDNIQHEHEGAFISGSPIFESIKIHIALQLSIKAIVVRVTQRYWLGKFACHDTEYETQSNFVPL